MAKRQSILKFGQKCTKFENILKKCRWLHAIITCNELLEKDWLFITVSKNSFGGFNVISRILFITHEYLIEQWKCCWLVSHIVKMIIQCQVVHAADYLILISAFSHVSFINSSISFFDWDPYFVAQTWSPVLILHCNRKYQSNERFTYQRLMKNQVTH